METYESAWRESTKVLVPVSIPSWYLSYVSFLAHVMLHFQWLYLQKQLKLQD